MSKLSLFATGVFLAVLALLAMDVSMDMWPAIGVQSDVCAYVKSLSGEDHKVYSASIKEAYKITCQTENTPLVRVNVEGMKMVLSPDQGLFSVVAMFSLLGGAVRSLAGLFQVLTGKAAKGVSLGWMAVRPFAGLAIALIVYVALRALLLPAGNIASANPYGYLAIAALIGFFTDAILLRLKSLSSPLFGSSG